MQETQKVNRRNGLFNDNLEFVIAMMRRIVAVLWLVFLHLLVLSDGYTTKSSCNVKRLMKSSIMRHNSGFSFQTMEATDNQILKFTEPKTNVTVILIGCMHYNPASIELTKQTIRKYAESQKLKAIVVESCPIRWEKSNMLYSSSNNPSNSLLSELSLRSNDQLTRALEVTLQSYQQLLKELHYNEMLAASELANEYAIPLILGDQLINVTYDKMAESFRTTLQYLSSPKDGGWKQLQTEIKNAVSIALPTGQGYLGLKDILDIQLLKYFPISLLKYITAFLLSSPITLFFFAMYQGLSFLLLILRQWEKRKYITIEKPSEERNKGWEGLVALTTLLLQWVLVSRTFLVTLLQERNEQLAMSIFEQCELIQQNEDSPLLQPLQKMKKQWNTWIHSWQQPEVDHENDDKEKMENVVVAVLGMAHCNGIKKLLIEGKLL